MALSLSNKENILSQDPDFKINRKSAANEVILTCFRGKPFQKGYQEFLGVLQKISKKNFLKNVPWSDIKKCYKKKTGRILNSDELNNFVGTTGLSR